MVSIDILAETGEPTGQVLDPKEAHNKELWHAASHVWLLNEKNEVLLQYRSEEKVLWPGLWDVSAAGHVDAGETPLEAAIRETSEEIGVTLTPEDLKTGKVLKGAIWIEELGVTHKEFWHIFFGRVKNPELQLQADEVSDAKWVSLDEFSQYIATPEKYKLLSHGEEYDSYVLDELGRLG